ncbi:hypothetical protein BJX96DRAFT_167388 [Aspergillus floccosus]
MYQIPDLQWAQVIDPIGPRPGEILVNIKYSGVCRSDLHIWKGGHEGAGVVVAIGDGVKDIEMGEHVGVQWINGACGTCEVCAKDGDILRCRKASYSGGTVDGTFQEYCICKARSAVRIPKEYDLELVAPVLCAGVTSYKAILECGAQAGDLVAIVGAGGGLGSLACQYAKALGYRVLAVSRGEERRRLCTDQLGVDYFVDYKSSKDIVTEIQSITPDGPHAVVVVASAMEPFQAALQYVRFGGTVVMVGLPPGGVIMADVMHMVFRTINIKASYVGTREETEKALEIFFTRKFFPPFQTVDLKDLPLVFDRMQDGRIGSRIILLSL